MIERPMLAASVDPKKGQLLSGLRYPMLASPKLDGIRCLIHPTLGPVTRSFKPIPNVHIRSMMLSVENHGLDGELMAIDRLSGKPLPFPQIHSAVMSQHGTPEFEFWVFDRFYDPLDQGIGNLPYILRYRSLEFFAGHLFIRPVVHEEVLNDNHAQVYATDMLAQGFEGIVLRDKDRPYKSNRSTWREQGMVKYKQFADADGVIIGFEERYRNDNPQGRDAFGLAERSTHKEGLVATNTLGALVLQTAWGELRVGSGFDMQMRDEIWQNKEKYLGKTVAFKYQPHGMQDLPRFPTFFRFREE